MLFLLDKNSKLAVATLNHCANDTDIIDHILYDTTINYNRHKIPSDPVTVRIEMWIQEVTSVSEMTQDFEIDLYVNEFWEDQHYLMTT
uniref:Neurotransmitter-gated ion-channel ligand-binding domain-containing protein n=1 Tax=Ditylenchus dipsaci TaxID=166011 RepID=A0A915DNX5_9BILA